MQETKYNPLEEYEIYEKIGSGGGGTVYRAYHKNLQKEVIIKKTHSYISNTEMQRVEVDILKNLHHQYLPQVFNFFVIDGIAYTVMDFVKGGSLKARIESGVHYSEKQILKYAEQLCEVLAYLHSQPIPIIHGDINPSNIMLTPEDNICLIDFNISGSLENGKAVTYGCTRNYCAPEQYQMYLQLKEKAEQARKSSVKSNQPMPAQPSGQDATLLLNQSAQGQEDRKSVV